MKKRYFILPYCTLLLANLLAGNNIVSAQGFATQPLSWPVPVGGGTGNGNSQGFYQSALGETGRATTQAWTTMDLNGDNKPDLVVHSQSNGNVNATFGSATAPLWRVYLNSATVTGTFPASTPTLAVYPTPFHSSLTLEATQALGSTYKVLDCMGRSWAQGVISSARQELTLDGLPAGLYIIQLDGLARQALKIVKQ